MLPTLPDPPKKLEGVIEGLQGVVFDPCLFLFEARQWAEVLKEVLTVVETTSSTLVALPVPEKRLRARNGSECEPT